MRDLYEILYELGKVAVAFSGGVDSTCLLLQAHDACEESVAFIAKTPFFTAGELESALELCSAYGIVCHVVDIDFGKSPEILENPADRCLLCKRRIFSELKSQAKGLGFDVLVDGTNADDDPASRPGMKALVELGVKSPLREAGLSKADVRAILRERGIDKWSEPSNTCLATRIPTGTPIDDEKLEQVSGAETMIHGLGLKDLRVRWRPKIAVVELSEENEELASNEDLLPAIRQICIQSGFQDVMFSKRSS